MTLRKNIEELLSEDPTQATLRSIKYFDSRVPDLNKVVLFGAGNIGRMILKKMRHAGIEPLAFVDETPSKISTFIEGLEIISLETAYHRYGSDLTAIITILNPNHDYIATERMLKEKFGMNAISFLACVWKFPDSFKSLQFMVAPDLTLSQGEQLLTLSDGLADDQSRLELEKHIRFRLYLDFHEINILESKPYFTKTVPLNLPKDVKFIDAGAYDGDTIRLFLDHAQNQFSHITAIEPDPVNFKHLSEYVQELSPDIRNRIKIKNVALSGKAGKLYFNATGDMNSNLGSTGNIEVDVDSLETIISEEGNYYIKFDIEGAESETISNSLKIIQERRPAMAISVYHSYDDIWSIPNQLKELDMGYKFYLRSHGIDGTDLICYALPN
ncbi:MAG: FkbM family methyltransferase [Alphaproteobacteria bacterium]|nr:FkbM family methyltransferase [Alphaproteobacteria bacterium]